MALTLTREKQLRTRVRKGMKMLVVRSGGREHALAEKLSEAGELFIAHGNAGTAHRYKLPKSN